MCLLTRKRGASQSFDELSSKTSEILQNQAKTWVALHATNLRGCRIRESQALAKQPLRSPRNPGLLSWPVCAVQRIRCGSVLFRRLACSCAVPSTAARCRRTVLSVRWRYARRGERCGTVAGHLRRLPSVRCPQTGAEGPRRKVPRSMTAGA